MADRRVSISLSVIQVHQLLRAAAAPAGETLLYLARRSQRDQQEPGPECVEPGRCAVSSQRETGWSRHRPERHVDDIATPVSLGDPVPGRAGTGVSMHRRPVMRPRTPPEMPFAVMNIELMTPIRWNLCTARARSAPTAVVADKSPSRVRVRLMPCRRAHSAKGVLCLPGDYRIDRRDHRPGRVQGSPSRSWRQDRVGVDPDMTRLWNGAQDALDVQRADAPLGGLPARLRVPRGAPVGRIPGRQVHRARREAAPAPPDDVGRGRVRDMLDGYTEMLSSKTSQRGYREHWCLASADPHQVVEMLRSVEQFPTRSGKHDRPTIEHDRNLGEFEGQLRMLLDKKERQLVFTLRRQSSPASKVSTTTGARPSSGSSINSKSGCPSVRARSPASAAHRPIAVAVIAASLGQRREELVDPCKRPLPGALGNRQILCDS